MSQYNLSIEARDHTGRSASRRLRKNDRIPAVLYGRHTKPENLSVARAEFEQLLKGTGGRAVLIELNHAGRSNAVLSFLQEIQRDPITDRYLHVDLQEVKADEKMEIQVRVRIIGDSIGVKNENGVLETATHTLRVRCLPKDLPAIIEVDVTELKVGDTIKVSELKPITGVEFLDQKGQPVVSCVEAVEEIAAVDTTTVAAAATPEGAAAATPAAGATGAAAAATPAAPAAGAAPAKAAATPAKPAAPAHAAKK